MTDPPHGRQLWLAPVLGGIGVTVGVAMALTAVRRGDALLEALAVVALTTLIIALSISLVGEQRGWRSAASRLTALEQQLAHRDQALSEAGRSDQLTGLRNRLAFYETLEEDFPRAVRAGVPIACVLVDIDHFRRVNDRFGHAFGDAVLQQFTRLLLLMLRGGDLICRFGGDEFMLLLDDSNATQAAMVAERVRLQLKREVFSDGSAAAAVTASFGIAVVPSAGVTHPGQLIERVEAALSEAKRSGRDRVAIDVAAIEAAEQSEAAQAERQAGVTAVPASEPEERPDA